MKMFVPKIKRKFAYNESRDLGGVGAVFLGLACVTQMTYAETETPKSNEGVFEEVVVSARKRDERLQETPVSISVFTAKQIEEAGIQHARDYLGLTPNVHIADSQDPSNVAIQVRGIGQIRNGEAPVAIVVDGVILPSALNIDQELNDIQQIEVLKGPQGALYGRNAIAGAINITTKQPTNEFQAKVIAGLGNGDSRKLAANVGGALVEDQLFFRLAGSFHESDGLITNPTLGEEVDFIDEQNIQARLTWLASESLTVDFRVAHNINNGGSGYFALASVNNGQPGQPQITTIDQQANTIVPPRGNLLGETDRDATDFALLLDWDLTGGALTSITSYSDLHQIAAFPGPEYSDQTQCTSFSVPFFTHEDCPDGVAPNYFGGEEFWHNYQEYDLKTFSQEIRFTSPDENRLRYLFGAYYLKTERDLDTVNNFSNSESRLITEINIDPTETDPFRTRNFFSELNENEAYAVFAQINYDLTDALELSLSARYDNDDRSQVDPRPDAFRTDGNFTPIPASVPRSRSDNFDSFQPKVTLKYVAHENLSYYATYAEGFRSGGFNAPGSEAIADNVYDEETSKNIEVGFKSQWNDRRTTLNAALFYSEVDNLQVFNFFGSVGLQLVTALDEVDIIGGEAEFNHYFNDNFLMYASVGLSDTEIKVSEDNPAAVGNEVPYNTKFSANLGGQYSTNVSDTLEAVFRLDLEHKGETPFHEGGHFSGIPIRDALTLVNARISLKSEDDWKITLWGRNLSDKEYWSETVVPDFAFQANPRTFGIEFSKQFN